MLVVLINTTVIIRLILRGAKRAALSLFLLVFQGKKAS